MSEEGSPRKRRRLSQFNPDPYVLKTVIDDIPLATDDSTEPVSITSVEHWNGNLYIGTSASEILHLVALPAEDESEPPTYILASRLQPSGNTSAPPTGQLPGVQKILVLPGPSKACVLCNGVISFYTLPELTPAYPGRAGKDLTGVSWIGGYDENVDLDNEEVVAIVIATARRLLLVNIGDRLRQIRAIDFPGCLRSSRRETIACVADDVGYSLLEVEHQQKIPLSPISTRQEPPPSAPTGIETPPGHSRSKSLGTFSTEGNESQGQNLEVPNPEQRPTSPLSGSGLRRNSRPRSSTDATAPSPTITPKKSPAKLRPNILSPSPEEFMFTTGTARNETGVGVFVNLEGDVSRGTIEFDRYPESLLLHSFSDENATPSLGDKRQFLLALLDKTDLKDGRKGVEIQELSNNPTARDWVRFPINGSASERDGLHKCISGYKHSFSEIADLLQSVRYNPTLPDLTIEPSLQTRASIERLEQETALFENHSLQSVSPTIEYEQQRSKEEKTFVSRLGHVTTKAVAWTGTNLWQILPNPLLLQLEHRLLKCGILKEDSYSFDMISVTQLMSLVGSIRDRETQDETEYLTINYIRQKASTILFLFMQTRIGTERDIDRLCRMVSSALEDGQIDPRIVLLLIPPLAREVLQGQHGIWLPQGLVDVLTSFTSKIKTFQDAPVEFWMMVRQYLNSWLGKRGFGSIPDEKLVFDSVEAALLHTLLYLDQALPEGGLQISVRTKLNNVVDHWKGDFHKPIVLLEHYHRLYALSRLYQSRKLARDVLATWRRILEGEQDDDKSLTVATVELQMRRYLAKIGNANLFQEYGLWLAQRNPDLAVQMFTDDESRVKLSPAQLVAILKEHAPGAVQKYLEHLVFGKHLDQYADDLIGYYLDSVLNVLEISEEAKQSLEQSYTTYRALTSPKPTYLDFITQNAPPQSWWQSRLRLLQLLGSGGYATAAASQKDLTYSVDKVLERLNPFSTYLVSESIILDARQGRHKEALKLLTHGLGDYDTAVRYCYFGGPAPTSSQPIDESLLPSREIQQDLFASLFHEFLRIDDVEERLERTSHLLGKFATWFDPLTVFDDIPEDWTVQMLSEFLLRSLRAATSQRNEAIIVKALSAAQNLQQQAAYIEMCEKFGSRLVADTQDSPQDLNSVIS